VKWEGPPLRDWCYWSEYDDTPVPVLGYLTGWRELDRPDTARGYLAEKK
jgi:hypothetical protein